MSHTSMTLDALPPRSRSLGEHDPAVTVRPPDASDRRVASTRAYRRIQPALVVICTFACTPHAPGHDGRSWHQAVELAQAGFDVWVVTGSAYRTGTECALARLGAPNLRFLYWDLPGVVSRLDRWRWGRSVHRTLWYRHVHGAIGTWQAAVGMRIVRRFVHRSRSSLTYLAAPFPLRDVGADRFPPSAG